jgi:AcrR family transcriptional regulator
MDNSTIVRLFHRDVFHCFHVVRATGVIEMPSKSMRKGEQTRAAILEVALDLASRDGLEGLTIGLLAEKMGMSKSGVFAHFGSREDLQIAVLKQYNHLFEQDVFYPSLKMPRGLPRLQELYTRWIKRVSVEIASGCIYISGAVEYDDRPGAIREELVHMVSALQNALRRCVQICVDEGHLPADTDPQQMVFEMYGLVLALHHDARFIKRPGSVERAHNGFARLVASYQGISVADTIKSVASEKSKPSVKKTA